MQRLTFGIMHCDYRAVGLTGDIERCDGPNHAKGVDVVADIPRRVPPGITAWAISFQGLQEFLRQFPPQ